MKDPVLCGKVLDIESDLSKSLPFYVNRFPEYQCVISENKANEYIKISLLFSKFRKGTILAMDAVAKKHPKIEARTSDKRIMAMLIKRYQFRVDDLVNGEWLMRRDV